MNNTVSASIARAVREVYLSGTWIAANLKVVLADIDWQEATRQVGTCNSIAALVFHMNYYVAAVTRVLEGGPLDAHDRYSFDHPPITSQKDWERLLDRVWTDAERFADLIERLPDDRLGEDFVDGRYGDYYRNLQGIVEHSYYHLGQIVLIKKILRQAAGASPEMSDPL